MPGKTTQIAQEWDNKVVKKKGEKKSYLFCPVLINSIALTLQPLVRFGMEKFSVFLYFAKKKKKKKKTIRSKTNSPTLIDVTTLKVAGRE